LDNKGGLLERTFVLIKPDAVQRGLIGEIVSRLEKRGLKLIASKFIRVSKDFAERHYSVHKGKTFFNGLVQYLSSTPVMAMVWEGENAVALVRQTTGATNPLEAQPGTIRHDLSAKISRNLAHASDSPDSANDEIRLWFMEEDIYTWNSDLEKWIYGNN
jgi:nucleoside-diphosphate kinase